MKCKICDGKGKTTEYDGLRKFWCDYKCEYCNGTGEVEKILCDNCSPRLSCSVYRNGDTRTECEFYQPMTEQEYLQTCNTEQLAEYILNVWLDGAFNVNAEFGLNEAQIEKHKGYIVEWLKQPHTFK